MKINLVDSLRYIFTQFATNKDIETLISEMKHDYESIVNPAFWSQQHNILNRYQEEAEYGTRRKISKDSSDDVHLSKFMRKYDPGNDSIKKTNENFITNK